MAKTEKVRSRLQQRKETVFPFERVNYMILLAGVVVIVLGYLALSEMTVDGFFPLTVAPILLVLGYCVIIPIGIIYRKKPKDRGTPEQ